MNPTQPSRPDHSGADVAARSDEGPPFLGTWGRVYAAIGAWALVTMSLLALFSLWPY